ncbi:MAG: copper homeostasis protein CutC [Gemmatimonadales bacterium]
MLTSGRPLVEVAVDSVTAARLAAEAGADRLELCQALEVGGLTPSLGLLEAVRAAVAIPVFVMIRSRPGPFVADESELAVMARDVELAVGAGAAGVVAGLLGPKGGVDVGATRLLVERAGGVPFTFHRAFDAIPNSLSAMATLRELGVSRILTSGGAPTADQGRAAIRRLVEEAAGSPVVLAGGGVQGVHVARLVAETRVAEIHLAGVLRNAAVEGFGCESRPDPDRVRRVLAALPGAGSRR